MTLVKQVHLSVVLAIGIAILSAGKFKRENTITDIDGNVSTTITIGNQVCTEGAFAGR
jgi:hypothetical protein